MGPGTICVARLCTDQPCLILVGHRSCLGISLTQRCNSYSWKSNETVIQMQSICNCPAKGLCPCITARFFCPQTLWCWLFFLWRCLATQCLVAASTNLCVTMFWLFSTPYGLNSLQRVPLPILLQNEAFLTLVCWLIALCSWKPKQILHLKVLLSC